MAVSITPRDLITPLDLNWAEKARENDRRGNQNEANLKSAVEVLQDAPAPVRKVKAGSTTYSPNADGLVTLPSGVVLPATTSTERDAIVNPTIGQGIYNTTTAQPEVYTPTGWRGFYTAVQIDVFTASGTWTLPAKARAVHVACIGGGGGGHNGNAAYAGAGGGRAAATIATALLPATVSVTVGIGGAAGAPGQDGGTSTFGTFVGATGGRGGNSDSSLTGGGPLGTPASINYFFPEAGGYAAFSSNRVAGPSGYGGGGGGNGNFTSGGASGALPGGSGTGAPGQSRSGSGLAGSGGGYQGAGGIPGGGGGAIAAGGRGEVVIVTIF